MSDAEDAMAGAPPALRVVRGGTPTPEQLAALVIALSPVAGGAADEPDPRGDGWRRAALMEAVGHRVFLSADDVAFGRRALG